MSVAQQHLNKISQTARAFLHNKNLQFGLEALEL
jgi:hypothetical protein